MNGLYRALIALSTVVPISISYVFVFADSLIEQFPAELVSWCSSYADPVVWLLVVATVANLAIGKIEVWLLICFAKVVGPSPIKVKSIKVIGSDSLLGYLPYVLPLFFTQPEAQGATGWIAGGLFLIVLAWTSMTIPFSPLLRVCGLYFYEAELEDGKTVTLLVANKRLHPLKLNRAAVVSQFCRFGLR